MDEWTQFSPRNNNCSVSSSPLSPNNETNYEYNYCDILNGSNNTIIN